MNNNINNLLYDFRIHYHVSYRIEEVIQYLSQANISKEYRSSLAIELTEQGYYEYWTSGTVQNSDEDFESYANHYIRAFRQAGIEISPEELYFRLALVEIEQSPVLPDEFIVFELCPHHKDAIVNAFAKRAQSVSVTETYDILGYLGVGGQKEVSEIVQSSAGQRLALKRARQDRRDQFPLFGDEARLQAGCRIREFPLSFPSMNRKWKGRFSSSSISTASRGRSNPLPAKRI